MTTTTTMTTDAMGIEDADGVYVQTMSRYDGWGIEVTEAEHVAAMERMQRYLDEHEPDTVSASVRSLRRGEIDGLYFIQSNGNEQILGHSLPVPTVVEELYAAAWQHALDTWPAV